MFSYKDTPISCAHSLHTLHTLTHSHTHTQTHTHAHKHTHLHTHTLTHTLHTHYTHYTHILTYRHCTHTLHTHSHTHSHIRMYNAKVMHRASIVPSGMARLGFFRSPEMFTPPGRNSFILTHPNSTPSALHSTPTTYASHSRSQPLPLSRATPPNLPMMPMQPLKKIEKTLSKFLIPSPGFV